MFVSFDPFTFLAIIFVCFFVPGALLSFSILRREDFLFIEKAFVGFGLAIVLIPAIPFLLYFFLGIKYTYNLALVSVGLFYLISIAALAYTKTYQDLVSFFTGGEITKLLKDRQRLIIPILLLVLLFISLWIRFGSYSPVYQELDPYFYTYVAQQIIVLGENPWDDKTAWYPELEVEHRIVPELGYLEAIWYSLYNGSNDYDNMLLATISSTYPAVAAMLAVFFLYLLIGVIYKREYGIIGAGIASFAPMFIYKLMAGEQEVQPYAFFALAFFFAMYTLMLLRKEVKFAVLSGIAFLAVVLGSASEVLAMGALIIFLLAYGMILYVKEDTGGLKTLLKLNAIFFTIGVLLGSAILKGLFYDERILTLSLIPAAIILAFLGFLITLQERLRQYPTKWVAVALIILGALVVLSPLGEPFKRIGASGFAAAQFTSPLLRTIAEQGTAGGFLHSSIGFVAAPYESVGTDIFTPVVNVLNAVLSPAIGSRGAETFAGIFEGLGSLLGAVLSIIFLPITVLTNLTFSAGVSIINAILDTNVVYSEKGNSMLFLWIFLFFLAFVYSVYRLRNKSEAIPIFFAAFILPAFLVGIIKAKYTIYSAFLLGAAIAFILGETDNFIRNFRGAGKENKLLSLDLSEEKRKKYAGYVMVFGFAILFFQFIHGSLAPSLLVNTFMPRFQDEPLASEEKFQFICEATGDSTVCAAAADPVGYASLGTNYQYDYRLCMYSVLSNYTYYSNPPPEAVGESNAAALRCHRISDYWIESMEWIRDDTEEGSRTTSWWDYGHWINYFGQRNAVLRNEHASHSMIGQVAYSYIHGTPEELIGFMREHDSKYALFDIELISSGSQLGGKYGALNYLSCAHMNRTTVEYSPGQSVCESEHLWEIIYVPKNPEGRTCTISEHQGRTGVMGYKISIGPSASATYTLYYPDVCRGVITDANAKYYCDNYVHAKPVYCVGEVTLADGSTGTGTYYLNETQASGDLKLNKAILSMPFEMSATQHLGDTVAFTLFYTNDRIWLDNGEIKGGYEDAKGEFYNSNLYRAIFVGEIPGFAKVFDNGAVKIYKIEE
jgi:asparagine N-glycosylation enzyme membrane subunit Stt3